MTRRQSRTVEVPQSDSQRPVARRPHGPRSFVRPPERHGHLATTAHTRALFGAQVQAGLSSRGVIHGRDAWGADFVFDQWLAYAEGVVSDPNAIVLGALGQGKSSLLKTWALRASVLGRRVEILDRKSEYGALIAALGGETIRLAGGTRVNPLERVLPRESRESLLRTLARTLLDRPLKPSERLGLVFALEAAERRESHRDVIVSDVVAQLRRPSPALTLAMDLPAGDCAAELRDLSWALRGLSNGPLRGLFDGPTSVGTDVWSRPAVCVDISGLAEMLYGTDEAVATAVALTCTTAFLDGRRRTQTAKTLRINDEGWRAVAIDPAYFSASLKLSRAHGVSTIFALHRLSDLSAAGDQGSQAQQLAEGLLSEISTRIVYRQAASEVDATCEALGLSDTERDLLTPLAKARADAPDRLPVYCPKMLAGIKRLDGPTRLPTGRSASPCSARSPVTPSSRCDTASCARKPRTFTRGWPDGRSRTLRHCATPSRRSLATERSRGGSLGAAVGDRRARRPQGRQRPGVPGAPSGREAVGSGRRGRGARGAPACRDQGTDRRRGRDPHQRDP